MNYNQVIISELSFINNMSEFNFFNKTLTEKVQQIMVVKNIKEFLDKHVRSAEQFKNSYGNIRYNEFYNKMGLFYFLDLPSDMVKSLREAIQNIDNDIGNKKYIDNIYELFFEKVKNNAIVLSTAIWMVKDSCVQGNPTYLLTNTGYKIVATMKRDYSLSNGEHETIELSNLELKEVEKYYNLLAPIILKKLNVAPEKNYSSMFSYMVEVDSLDRSKESSFVRALVALQNARSNSQLPVKIDFYIQLLQCIYGREGRSYNIQRMLIKYTTRLLNLNGEERDDAKKVIKTAFKIRSKQTHGIKINYSIEEIKEVAIQLDEYVREVLKMILPKKELDYNTKKEAKKVNEYFRNLNVDHWWNHFK